MQREGDALAGLPNGRPPTQLNVKQDGRKPLFSSAGGGGGGGGGGGLLRGDENARPQLPIRSTTGLPALKTAADEHGPESMRRTKSTSESQALLSARRESTGAVSPGGSRIPRSTGLKFLRGKPISLAEAYRLAQNEEAAGSAEDEAGPVHASPSPAPRPRKSKPGFDEAKFRQMLEEDHLDSKGEKSNSNNKAQMDGNSHGAQGTNGLGPVHKSPAKSFLTGSTLAGPGGESSKRSGNEGASPYQSSSLRHSLGASPAKHTPSFGFPNRRIHSNGSSLPELVPGIEDVPLPSVERSADPEIRSPEKSFAWQVDQDFTAGDLQVSDSPRLRVASRPFANRINYAEAGSSTPLSKPGSKNTKLDEIFRRELQSGTDVTTSIPRPVRPHNTKLDEILARESQAEKQIPIPSRHLDRLRNTKLDEIRQREADGVSRRAFAAARLEEIKEQNAMSRPRSPEERRPRSSIGLYSRVSARPTAFNEERRATVNPVASIKQQETVLPVRPQSAFEGDGGRRIPDTPVTIFTQDRWREKKDSPVEVKPEATAERPRSEERPQEDEAAPPKPELESRRSTDSRELQLLRRLARAASSSPVATETRLPLRKPLSPLPADDNRNKPASGHVASEKLEMAKPIRSRRISSDNSSRPNPVGTATAQENEKLKPTVGFTGLQRTRSVESSKSRVSNMQSELDPTDRIEAEINLFALGENQSEKGSTKALSVPADSDEEDEERNMADATPKPTKPDPLTMPTPRVTGAYVETPATVRVEKIIDEKPTIIVKNEESKPEIKAKPKPREDTKPIKSDPQPSEMVRDWRTSITLRNRDQDTSSDPGAGDDDNDDIAFTTSAAVRRPRARSLPRRRPPLKNSAKPPSVKDDLMQLQRVHNIEDSTLDDFEEILTGRRRASSTLQGLREDLTTKHHQSNGNDWAHLDSRRTSSSSTAESPASKIRNENRLSMDADSSDGDLAAAYNRMSKTLTTGLLGIRSAKQGIDRLHGHLAQAESSPQKPSIETKTATVISPDIKHEPTSSHTLHHQQNHQGSEKDCPYCAASATPKAVTYIHLALPRLFHRKPRFHLTILGILTLILSLWCAAESTMCSLYCRSVACSNPTKPCVWSFDDPMSFGTALPIKLDQWVTGGYGREVWNYAVEEVGDWYADMQDLTLGRDITKVAVETLSIAQRRSHRRRLGKKGLLKPPPEPSPEDKAKWDAWRRTRLARERAKEARELGYEIDDETEGSTIGGDERVW